jgi:hypothetical protein
MQEVIKSINEQIQKLELRVNDLKAVIGLLENGSSNPVSETPTIKAPARKRPKRRKTPSKPYRHLIVNILREQGPLGIPSITQELSKMGVFPNSKDPVGVIGVACCNLHRLNRLDKGRNSSGVIYSVSVKDQPGAE